jgi:hypothetical protein
MPPHTGIILLLSHNSMLPNPFQFIVHQLSYHLTLCTPATSSVVKKATLPFRDSNCDPSVVQPVARRYTHYAISAHVHFKMVIRDNSIGITTGCWLDGRGSILDRGKRSFSSPQRPNPLWGQPNFPPWGYRGLVKLTTHLHLASWSRMVEFYLHSPYVFIAWCLKN